MLLQKIFNQRQTKPNETGPRLFQIPTRQAGVVVNHDTALQSSAVYACVRVIAEDIATLPWHTFIKKQDGSRDRIATSPVEYVLNTRTNPDVGPFHFRETIIAHALTWGNGYAEIARDLAGRVSEMYIIAPDRVEVGRDNSGKVVYEINNSGGPNTYLGSRDVFHLHGIGFDGLVGYSMVGQAARSIGLSLSVEEFGAQFFGNGATLGGVIKIPAESRLSDDAKKAVRETFNKEHKTSKNAHKIEILDAGMEYQDIGVQPNNGQFIESRQHQVEEICRWFRVSPQKVAHLLRMTFNNVEQLSIDHVNDTLMPWITRLEDEANYKLFGLQNRNQYTKLITNALLRGDSEARTKFYRELWNLGVLSTNEIREYEELNPVPDGDKRFVQMNMTTLEKAGEEPEPAPIPEPQPVEEEQPEDIAAYKTLLFNKMQLLLQSEKTRFVQLKNQYEDRQEYIDRANGFLGGHRIKVVKAVEKHLIGALKALNHSAEEIGDAAQQYADKHVDLSRAQAIDYYDNQPTLELNQRAGKIADSLINSVMLYTKGISHVRN